MLPTRHQKSRTGHDDPVTREGAPGRGVDLVVTAAAGVTLGLLLGLLGVPSAMLFGGLAAGLARALLRPARLSLPQHAMTGAQALLGVSIGLLVSVPALRTLLEQWLPIVLVTAATLAISVVAGRLLALRRDVTPVTGAFAMVAGGASGIVAMARDLGADEQVVGVLQYLRVLLVVVTMPVVAAVAYGAAGSATAPAGATWPADLAVTVVSLALGLAFWRVTGFPVGALLGPLLVAAVVDLAGPVDGAELPGVLEAVAFVVIGLQVGLGFTRASLRTVAHVLPAATALTLAVIGACAGLGWLLVVTGGVDPLTAYLATTPGGLYAVLATARGSGADVTFVLAVQVLRLFAMLFGAPLLARWLRRGRPD